MKKDKDSKGPYGLYTEFVDRKDITSYLIANNFIQDKHTESYWHNPVTKVIAHTCRVNELGGAIIWLATYYAKHIEATRPQMIRPPRPVPQLVKNGVNYG